MPLETEEEEEIDEETSVDGLDDVEKIFNEYDASDFVLESGWRRRGNKNDKKSQKRDCVEGFETVEISDDPVTRKFRAEVGLKLRTKSNRCGSVGHWARECPQKVVTRQQRRRNILPRKRRERRISSTGVLETSHGFSVSLRVDTTPCWKGFADAVNNVRCSLLKKAKRLSLEGNQVVVSSRQC